MEFEELPAHDRAEEEAAVSRAAALLADGGLLVHPTSAVYGIGGEDAGATDREILALKGSATDRPLLRLVADSGAVRRLFPRARWSDTADLLASRFWPGPLTLVLEDGTDSGIAVRVDPHPLTRTVLRLRGRSLASTSLNAAGEAPAADPEGVRRILDGFPPSKRRVAFLNAGRLPGPPPSTIVSLRTDPPHLLREGAVPLARLSECLPKGIDR